MISIFDLDNLIQEIAKFPKKISRIIIEYLFDISRIKKIYEARYLPNPLLYIGDDKFSETITKDDPLLCDSDYDKHMQDLYGEIACLAFNEKKLVAPDYSFYRQEFKDTLDRGFFKFIQEYCGVKVYREDIEYDIVRK